MADPDPGDLVLAAGGDEAALTRLLERWRPRVFAAFERWEEPSAASDAAAEVFVSALRAAPSYDPAVPFPVWLFSHVARRFRETSAPGAPAVPVARLRESAAARTAFLRGAVAALPPKPRAAFLFTRMSRLPLGTAARALGLTEEETRHLMVQAMETLARTLSPILEPSPEAGLPPMPPGPGGESGAPA